MTVNFGEGSLYARPVEKPDAPWEKLGRSGSSWLIGALSAEEIVKLGAAMKRFLTMSNRQVRSMRRQLLGPFTEAEWQERTRQREAEEARLAQERREAREAAARAMAREILTETAPIEDRIERLAEIIIAAEYGGWDDLR